LSFTVSGSNFILLPEQLLTDQMAAPKKEEGEPDLVEDKSVDEKPASDVESGALAEKTAEPMQTDSEMEAATKEADDSQENTKNLFKMWTHKSVAGLDSPSTPSEDKSGDVKPAPDVAAGANTDQTPQKPVQTDSKKGDDSQGDTRNLFKMWSQKSVRGLDSGRPAPGVPRRARSSITAPTAEEEPSPAATDATPPKPGSLVVHGLEVRKLSHLHDTFHRRNVFTQFFYFLGTSG
jgi:hypothetical protein